MSKRVIAASLAAVLGLPIAACSAATPRAQAPAESVVTPNGVTIPTDSGSVTVPAGTGGTTGRGTGSTGPNEKDAPRGNTPPGMSRDGAGPAGGAIVDPAGVMKR